METKTVAFESPALRGGFTSIPNAVIEACELSAKELGVWTVLAKFAHKKDECWPGQDRLCEMVGMTDKPLRSVVTSLAEKGYLSVTRRGQGKSNIYRLKTPVLPEPDMRPATEPETGPVEEEKRRRKENYLKESTPKQPSFPSLFDDFWAAYPRRVSKGAARRAYHAALKKAAPAAILAGLANAKVLWASTGTDPEFIPHASTWLNGERWLDEPIERPQNSIARDTILRDRRNLSEAERTVRMETKTYPYDEASAAVVA